MNDSEPEFDILPLPGRSSKRNETLGKFYLTAATNTHMARDRARTLENLGKALQYDSELVHSRYVHTLVEQIIELDYPAAVALLMDTARRDAYIAQIGGKHKLTRRQVHGAGADSATWDNVRFEIGVMALLAVIGAALIIFLTPGPAQTTLDSYSYNTTARASERLADLRASSAGLRLGLALLAGAGITLMVVVSGALAHAAAIYLFAGEGTLVYLMRQLARAHTGALIIGVSTVLVMLLLDDVALRLAMLGLLGSIEIVIFVMLLSTLVGDVYAFGLGNGFSALAFAGLILSIAGLAGGFVLARVIA